MAKEFFKNLPDTSTPLNASRLNGLLNGNEAMGSIVVDDVRCSNLLNKNNPTYIGEGVTWLNDKFSASTTWKGLYWQIPVEVGKTYTFYYNARNSSNVYLYIYEYDKDGNLLRQIINDGTALKNTFTIENGETKYVQIEFRNNAVVSDVLIEGLRLNEGTEVLDYTPYKAFGIESGSNNNGSWVKSEDGTMICRGVVTTGDVTFTAWGSLYQYEVPSVSFPLSFVDVPHIDFTSNNPSSEYNYCLEAGTYQTTKSETGIMRVVRPLATTGRVQIKWTAIGRWK